MLKTITLLAYLLGNAQGGGTAQPSFRLMSPAFKNGGVIPKQYTCQGANVSIPVRWKGVPAGTQSFALVMSDADSPRGNWYHWILYNIPPQFRRLSKNSKLIYGERLGKNSWGNRQYNGPCPPHGEHRYLIQLYALDTRLRPSKHRTVRGLYKEIREHTIASTHITARYGAEAIKFGVYSAFLQRPFPFSRQQPS